MGLLLAALLVVGCTGGVDPASPATTGPAPSAAGRDAPPDATLAAEGGDPVTGQLGSYTWFGSGSDAPWLPGSPIAVGAGESLHVAFLPPGDAGSWTARYAAADAVDAGGPVGARPLGEGTGEPVFAAPGTGRWTVEVTITFPAGIGTATYFWELTVT